MRGITGKDFGVDAAAWRRGLEPLLRELSTATSTTVLEVLAAVSSENAGKNCDVHADATVIIVRSLLDFTAGVR